MVSARVVDKIETWRKMHADTGWGIQHGVY